jgi:hypothetical protein
MVPKFQTKKDPFVQKYQILLNHVQREKDLVKVARQVREKQV